MFLINGDYSSKKNHVHCNINDKLKSHDLTLKTLEQKL